MSYGLIYTLPFAALDGTPYTVEIEKEGYDGQPEELTGGESPFTVEIDDEEFLYTPVRFSTAKLKIVGGDQFQKIFSTGYKQYRITLMSGDTVRWCGFIKPEMYTQDYTSPRFELEMECTSAMSVLEYIDYTTAGDAPGFISLWDVLKKCVEASSGRYGGIYIPRVYAATKNDYQAATGNVLADMTISEQNFFDEEGEAMTLREVLEELCKFLGWTCADWGGNLYFVDVDTTSYRRYDAGLGSPADMDASSTVSVQDVGFAGTGHSLDILPGYNKVKIKCSNYSVEESSYDMADYADLPELATTDLVNGNNVTHKVFLNPQDTGIKQYRPESDGSYVEIQGIGDYKDEPEQLNLLLGALPVKYCNYEMVENGSGGMIPNINDYNYTHALQVRRKYEPNQVGGAGLPSYIELLTVKFPPVAYSNGVFCINGKYKILTNSDLSYTGSVSSFVSNMSLFGLRIGNYYFDGTIWKEPVAGGTTYPRISILAERGDADDYYTIPNAKKPTDPYDGASGYMIPIPGVMYGELEFSLLTPTGQQSEFVGYLWEDLRLEYVKQNGTGTDEDNADRIYENVINEDYINELDEIELKISSYTSDDGACYSKVMLDGDLLTDNLYNALLDKSMRPEQLLIARIISHYRSPRVKLTQPLKLDASLLTPIARLTDSYQSGKNFINTGGSIDYRMNRFECAMTEIGEMDEVDTANRRIPAKSRSVYYR